MNDQYLLLTNAQTPSGNWVLYADDQGTIAGIFDGPDKARGHLSDMKFEAVNMDVDGNGTIRMVPIEWIGDGEPIVGSSRAAQL